MHSLKHFRFSIVFLFCLPLSYSVGGGRAVEKNLDARHRRIDSVKLLLQKPQSDTLRVVRVIELANLYAVTDGEMAIKLVQEAKVLSEKINYPRGIFLALSALGGLYENSRNDYSTAYIYWTECSKVAKYHHLYAETHSSYYSLLNYYFHLGDFTSAMKIATEGFKLAVERMDNWRIAKYTSLFGFIHLRQNNIRESKKYYDQYLFQSRELKDSTLIAEAHEYLADVYMAENDVDRALEFRVKALRIYQSALIRDSKFSRHNRIPYNLVNIGLAYNLKGDPQTALTYCLKVINPGFPHGINDYEMASYYIITGNVYQELKELKKADSLFRLGLSISAKIKHAENVRDAYYHLSQLFEKQKRYDSALHYQVLFSLLKDSIINERSRREIERIQVEYDVERKDREIAINLQKAEQQKLISYGIAGAFIALLSILYLAYNRYQLKQKNRFQRELNQKQNELFNTVTSIQDQERKRIAQDIHDQVGSVLSAAKLQLSGLEELKSQLTEDQTRKYSSAMALMDEAAEELRNISHNLMPATLSRLGLVAALRALLEKISEYSGLSINFKSYGFEERLAEPMEINIYPIVLELINNIVKHSKANEATVQLIRYPDYINISVEDNGKGFDVEKTKLNGEGIGIRSLNSRIGFLNGTLNIDSSEGKGTTVMIDIPYKH